MPTDRKKASIVSIDLSDTKPDGLDYYHER